MQSQLTYYQNRKLTCVFGCMAAFASAFDQNIYQRYSQSAFVSCLYKCVGQNDFIIYILSHAFVLHKIFYFPEHIDKLFVDALHYPLCINIKFLITAIII